jgi:translation initiation factor 2-alpha kinase 4
MYSLGIILFEMSYPLGTAMERADILGRLREPSYSLPIEFEEREKCALGDIINSLLKHKVSERPSSLELLRSGKVPLQTEDESVRAALQGISDTTSPYHAKLIEALFDRKPATDLAMQDYIYEANLGPTDSANELLLTQMIKEKIAEVFRHHGAVETHRPLLIPSSQHYGNAAARLIDASGTLVQLPYDLTLPNARAIAKNAFNIRKTYAFGDVYRATPGGSHPKSHGEVDFDIVSQDNFDLALREAEVLKVIDEIIEVFPSMKTTQICYHIGHSRILDAILSFCEIPRDKWDAVKEVLSRLNIGQWTWAKIRNDLRGPAIAVPSTSLDDLVRFDFRDAYDKAIPKLRSLLRNTEELESTFSHLQAVTTYLARLKVKQKVYINPLSCINEKFYRGNILFQCLFNSKNRSMLAAGGRYDRLIQQHRPHSKIQDLHAVGFNLGWHSLVSSMLKYQDAGSTGKAFLKRGEEQIDSSWTTRRCDVLVDSVNPASLRTNGLTILQELWANQISAELSIDVQKGRRESASPYTEDVAAHSWTVLIKQDGSLKARSLLRKEDVELRSSELVGWLRSELRERDRAESKSIERTRLPRHMVHSDSVGTSTEREPDVRVLISQTKSKKTNRRNIVEDGNPPLSMLPSLIRVIPATPVPSPIPLRPPYPSSLSPTNPQQPQPAATNSPRPSWTAPSSPSRPKTTPSTPSAARGTRLADPESWRRVVQSAPLAERAYLHELHALLVEMADEGKSASKSCFLYNFRTRACVYYDLWRPA